MNALLDNVERTLKRVSSPFTFVLSLAYILVLGGIGFVAPTGFSFTLLYLLGVIFVAWRVGLKAAVLLSAVSSALCAWSDWPLLPLNSPRVIIITWNFLSRLVVFGLAGWATREAARLARHLATLVAERTSRWKAEAQQHRATSARLAETLQQVEERQMQYRAILTTAMDGFMIMNRQGEILETNEAYCKMVGRPPGEILQHNINEFDIGHTPEEISKRIAEIARQGARFETRHRCRDERGVDLDVSASCLSRDNGPIIAFIRDITARKQIEQLLREAEARYRSLVEHIPAVCWVSDLTGTTVYISQNVEQIYGFTPNEIYQGGPRIWFDHIYPEDLPRVRAAYQSLFQGQPYDIEYRFRTKKGAWVWVNDRSSFFLERGDHKHAYGVFFDITERKRAQFLLQAQRDIGVRLSLTSNLQEGLDQLLRIATHVDRVDAGGVYLLDSRTRALRLSAHHGLSEAFLSRAKAYAAGSRESAVVDQARPLYACRNDLPWLSGLLEDEGIQGLAVLPLCHEGAVLGSLNLASRTYSDFPAQTRVELEAIATQAAGAIARIRAEQALHESEARLRTIIRGAPILLLSIDADGIITFEEGPVLRPIGVQPGEHVGQSLRSAYGRFPQLVQAALRAQKGKEFSALVHLGSMPFDFWFSPTSDRLGNLTGCSCVGLNITERQRLQRQLLEIADREQDRIGQEIHDGLCQQLVGLAFDANSLEKDLVNSNHRLAGTATRLADLLDQAITESRRLSRGLFPIRLDADGLPPALEELAKATSERYSVRCVFLSPSPVSLPNKTVATHLFRIAHEAVSNAVRHGRPRVISILLTEAQGELELQVEDDGAGFPVDVPANRVGMGLYIMDYRARSIGGTLRISPGQGGGIRVSCCVPVTHR